MTTVEDPEAGHFKATLDAMDDETVGEVAAQITGLLQAVVFKLRHPDD